MDVKSHKLFGTVSCRVDPVIFSIRGISGFGVFLLILLSCACSQHMVRPGNDGFTAPLVGQAVVSGDELTAHAEESEFVEDSEEYADLEDEFGGDEPEDLSDPLGGYNRAMTRFNDRLYFWLLNPVANVYRVIIPKPARRGINNFFTNIVFPERFAGNLLQFKFKKAGVETVRFVTNSTIGVFGLWDPAKSWFGLQAYPEESGQTLGHWGVAAGPHIVLPFLGPSNLRDTIGLGIDWQYLDLVQQIDKTETRLGLWALDEVNYVSLHAGEYEDLKKDAVDFYPFMRDVYRQNRQKEIEE